MPEEFKRHPKDTPEVKRDKAAKRKAWHAAHKWAPNRLRHTAGTLIREEYGVEAASVILGHRSISTSEIYAEKNVKAAERIMATVG
jgi:site-specific recombinase XerD